MQTLNSRPVVVVELAANDLPEPSSIERARRRERDRKRKGPMWSEPARTVIPA